VKSRNEIDVGTDARYFEFRRYTGLQRRDFGIDWWEVGHRTAPIVVVVGLLLGLLAVWLGAQVN
jgi:hypothetical protein